MRRLVLSLIFVGIAAGGVRAGNVEVDFNPKAEFERFKTWAFFPGQDEGRKGVLADASMRDRVQKALAGHLLGVGLRPAEAGEAPDLLVRYGGDTGTGKTVTTSEGYYYDGLAPAYRTTRFDEQFVTLIVDLVDAQAKTLAWRLYIHERFGGPNDPPDKFLRAVEKGFAKYPPSKSQREKKARQLEKESKAR